MTDPNAQPPQQPAYQPVQPVYVSTDYPGKTLGIVGLVFAFVFAVVGIILSAIALSQSKAAGFKNTPAKVGLILSIIFVAIYIIWIVIIVIVIAVAAAHGDVTSR